MLRNKCSITPVFAFACLLSSACVSHQVELTPTDISTIKSLNNEVLHKLLIEKDPAALSDIALDQYLVVAPGGRV